MSLPKYKPFFEWARFALTGDSQATVPADDVLYFVTRSALAEVLADAPCANNWETYEADGDDEAAFREAVGAKIAERWLDTPAGKAFLGETEEIKTGSITTRSKPMEAGALQSNCAKISENAKDRLSCVIAEDAARAAAHPVSLFKAVGNRRSMQSRCGNGGY